MADVICFSYHNTKSWWEYIANNLEFASSTLSVSDLREKIDISIVDDFYHNIKNKDCAHIAVNQFSQPVCDDIIRRCRVLRNIDKNKALSMIGSMWLIFDEIIKNEKPRLVISFIIDRYTSDILDRVLKSYNIPFLAMTASIVPDHVMFMDRGKLFNLREPAVEEVEQAKIHLVNDSFAPSYVSNSKKYTHSLYWRTFIYFKLRGLAFQIIRYLKRDTLNLHYLDALNHLSHKPGLLDYKVLRYQDHEWENKLNSTPPDKRVFLAMQLLPEASLDYWLDDLELLNNEEVVLEICSVLGNAGYQVFLKDHPLQFGFRKRDVIQKLAKLPFVILVPYDVPANRLIKECPTSVTFTGTIGFQSALVGACSIVSNAYYSDQENFIHFNNLNDIKKLPEKIAAFKKEKSKDSLSISVDSLIKKILAASIPGDLFTFRKFNKNDPDHITRVQPLIDSLNKSLPAVLEK